MLNDKLTANPKLKELDVEVTGALSVDQNTYTEYELKLIEILDKSLISPTEEYVPAHIIWGIQNEDGSQSQLGTAGDFSLVIGKAKSKKTFFMTMAAATAASDGLFLGKFFNGLKPGKNTVAYFDTEQGREDGKLTLNRICRQLGNKNPTNLKYRCLRTEDWNVRRDAIQFCIYNDPTIGFVIIDGVVDICEDFMDSKASKATATQLMKWSEQNDLHIIAILHQNKGNTDARGHLGTELINKAQTTISVTRQDARVSIVAPEFCRSRDFEPFAFEIGDNGLPMLVDGFDTKEERPAGKTRGKLDIEDIRIFQILNEVFSFSERYKYSELRRQLSAIYHKQVGTTIGTSLTEQLITKCKINRWILSDDSNVKEPYILGSFKPT